MPWDVTTDPVHFEEAIKWFRKKNVLSEKQFAKLTKDEKKRAFKVAGVGSLSVVSQVWADIDRAIAKGESLQEFKKAASDKLRAAWGGSVANPGDRIETIFRTNLQSAYSSGRYEQTTDPDILEAFPYWQFDAILDDRTSEICEPLDGTIQPANNEWWQSHMPPLHHRCRSTHIALTAEQAGQPTRPPKVVVAEGFGSPPKPNDWTPTASDYPKELWNVYKEKSKP